MVSLPRRPTALACAAFGLLAACHGAIGPQPAPAASRATAAGASRPLRLGVIGDQTLAADLDAAYAVLARGVAELARYHREVAPLDAVVHTGDLVESSAAPDEVARRFRQAAEILDRLPVPWYPTAGDHDVNPPGYRPGAGDASRRELYVALAEERLPPRAFSEPGGLLHYRVDLGSHSLIVLDSQEVAHADPRWGDVFLARIGEGQLAWLEAELAAAGGAEGIVVVLHQPQWLAWSGWQRVHELLRRHPVELVLSAHLHHPQDGGVLDGIRYLTVGAAGGTTRRGSRSAGAVQHVTVVELAAGAAGAAERGAVRTTLLPLDGRPLALPSRRDMERAQALEVMLGALWELAATTPIRLDGERLVAACGSDLPARILLRRMGNPIDVETSLTVSWSPPLGVHAAFTPGFCAPPAVADADAGASRCRLPAPSPNVVFANPSGVELAPHPPLWQATLDPFPVDPGALVADGLVLTVTVSWEAESGTAHGVGDPLRLERSADLAVDPCR